jgi:hypothetical protein
MSLPKSFAYGPKSSSVAAIASSYKLMPSNGSLTFSEGDTIRLDLPAGIRAQYLDTGSSYITFDLTVTLAGGTTPKWAAHPWDCIENLSLYSSAGGQQLESISQYGALYHLLRDFTSDHTASAFYDSIMANSSTSQIKGAAHNNSAVTVRCAFPLLSVMGLISAGDKMIPLCKMRNSPRLELTLAKAGTAITTTGAPSAASYSLSNVRMHLGLITLSDSAQNQIDQMTNGVYSFNAVGWRNFRQTHAAGQLTNSILCPARFASTRSLWAIMRGSADLESRAKYSVSERIRNFLDTYQWRVGSRLLPEQPVSAQLSCEAYANAAQVFGMVNIENAPTQIFKGAWEADASADPSTSVAIGSFAVGLGTQPFAHADEKLLSGVDTTAVNTFLDLNFKSGSAPVACAVDMFVSYDSLWKIQDGEVQVSY